MRKKEFDIEAYRNLMARRLGPDDGKARLFWKALTFAIKAHEGQWRKSGDAYILHPCRAAQILVEEMDIKDPEILAATLLHDTVEDVEEVTTEIIGELFGKHVAAIVDGCTKVIKSSIDKQRFVKLVHRKIFSGAAARLEVMLVKLADRLHNLRTLNAMSRDRRQRIAEETLDIYAPMARVMGFFDLKRELYDLALQYKFPRQSNKVLAHIRKLERDPVVKEITSRLQEEMKKAWIDCKITGRAKGLWGYFNPAQKLLFKEIDHPMEFIIRINDVHSCYRALGIINQNFPPIPRTIRDFIANPKPTGYQGLHARANIKGHNFLFKIRTPQMATRAQRGILKGWSVGEHGVFEKELKLMFDVLGADNEFSARDMIAASGKKEIYTFTPKGERVCLPKQSVVLDFAFHVHSELGNRCVAALVGRQRVGPDHTLKDGDRVKIITRKKQIPFDPLLLDLCQTPRARSGLAKGFRSRRQDLAEEAGYAIVKQEIKQLDLSFKEFKEKKAASVLADFGLASTADLFLEVGRGRIDLTRLKQKTLEAFHQAPEPPPESEGNAPLSRIYLSSLDPACIKFSACCKPLPTDNDLLGLLSDRGGISIHRTACHRLHKLKTRREDLIEVRWRLKESLVTKPQHLYIQATNRNRLLMLLAVAPVSMKISEINALSRADTQTPDWEMHFEVPNLHDLRSILHHFAKAGLAYEFVLDQ